MWRVLVLSLVFCVGVVTASQAVIVYDVDFNSMTIGQPPTTGSPPNQPFFLWADENTTCLVQTSYGGLTDKPVVFSDANTSGSTYLVFSVISPISSGQINVHWLVSAHQIGEGCEMSCNNMFMLMFDADATLRLACGDGQGGVDISSVGSYSVDTPIEFDVEINLTESTFDLYMDEELEGDDLPFVVEGTEFALFAIGTLEEEPTVAPTNYHAVDDVVIEALESPVHSATWGAIKALYR